MYEEILNSIGDTLSDLASSKDVQDGQDKEDDEDGTELGKLSDDDEPGWVMGTFTKTVQHCMESFQRKQMRLAELTQPGWGDAANCWRERDMRYGITELKGSGGCPAPNTLNYSHTIPDNSWRAYADSWDCPRSIGNARSDFLSTK